MLSKKLVIHVKYYKKSLINSKDPGTEPDSELRIRIQCFSVSVFIDVGKMFDFLISQYTRFKKFSSFRLIFLFKWTGEQEKGNIVQDSRLDTIFFAKQVPLMHLPYALDIIRCIGVRSFGQCCGYVFILYGSRSQ